MKAIGRGGGSAVRIRVTGPFAAAFLFAAVAAGHAQAPPPPIPGFVSSFEIVRTLRSAGFDPLAPPLREGTVYVVRATDYRGILMRVVLDARTGAIRDANRIVPGPGNYAGPYVGPYGEPSESGPYAEPSYGGLYGPYGEAYGPERYGPEPYGPRAYGRVDLAPPPDDAPQSDIPAAPPLPRPGKLATSPPLPRPRPPQLASRKPAEAAKPSAAHAAKPDATAAPPIATGPAKPAGAPAALSINN
jgi:hypothetical protein